MIRNMLYSCIKESEKIGVQEVALDSPALGGEVGRDVTADIVILCTSPCLCLLMNNFTLVVCSTEHPAQALSQHAGQHRLT